MFRRWIFLTRCGVRRWKTARKFTELETLRHPPDHPAGFKEAEYLKVIT